MAENTWSGTDLAREAQKRHQEPIGFGRALIWEGPGAPESPTTWSWSTSLDSRSRKGSGQAIATISGGLGVCVGEQARGLVQIIVIVEQKLPLPKSSMTTATPICMPWCQTPEGCFLHFADQTIEELPRAFRRTNADCED
jgi:hypothetical protein